MLLSKFGNEVLSKGPQAVLPQNLTPGWLKIIQKMADDFLDTNFDGENCRWTGFAVDPILSACVSEILIYLNDGNVDIHERELFEKLTMYSLAVTVETVSQETEIDLAAPTLDNIFDKQRFRDLKRIKPEFGPILDIVCLNSGD